MVKIKDGLDRFKQTVRQCFPLNLTGSFAHFYVLQLAHEQLKAYATISPHPDGKTHFTNADFVHAYKRLKPGHGA